MSHTLEDDELYNDIFVHPEEKVDPEVIKNLKEKIQKLELDKNQLCNKMNNLSHAHSQIKKENQTLKTNISSLFKTAQTEIERKARMIDQLRSESVRNSRAENHSHSPSNQQKPIQSPSTNSTSSQNKNNIEPYMYDRYSRDRHNDRQYDKQNDRLSDRFNDRYHDPRDDRYSNSHRQSNSRCDRDRYDRDSKSLSDLNRSNSRVNDTRLNGSPSLSHFQNPSLEQNSKHKELISNKNDTQIKPSNEQQNKNSHQSPNNQSMLPQNKVSRPPERPPSKINPPKPPERVVVRGPPNVFKRRLEVKLNHEAKKQYQEAQNDFKRLSQLHDSKPQTNTILPPNKTDVPHNVVSPQNKTSILKRILSSKPSSNTVAPLNKTPTSNKNHVPSQITTKPCSSLIDKIKELKQSPLNKTVTSPFIKTLTPVRKKNENLITKKPSTAQSIKAPQNSSLKQDSAMTLPFSIFEPEVQLYYESSCESDEIYEPCHTTPPTPSSHSEAQIKSSSKSVTPSARSNLRAGVKTKSTPNSKAPVTSLVDIIPVYDLQPDRQKALATTIKKCNMPSVSRPLLQLGEVSIKVTSADRSFPEGRNPSPHKATITAVLPDGKSSFQEDARSQNNQNEANCSSSQSTNSQTPLDEDSQDIFVPTRKRKLFVIESDEESSLPPSKIPTRASKRTSRQTSRRNTTKKDKEIDNTEDIKSKQIESIPDQYDEKMDTDKVEISNEKSKSPETCVTSLELTATSDTTLLSKQHLSPPAVEQNISKSKQIESIRDHYDEKMDTYKVEISNEKSKSPETCVTSLELTATSDTTLLTKQHLSPPAVEQNISFDPELIRTALFNATSKKPINSTNTEQTALGHFALQQTITEEVNIEATETSPISQPSGTPQKSQELNTSAGLWNSTLNSSVSDTPSNLSVNSKADGSSPKPGQTPSKNFKENRFSRLSKRRLARAVVKTITVTSPGKKETICVQTKDILKKDLIEDVIKTIKSENGADSPAKNKTNLRVIVKEEKQINTDHGLNSPVANEPINNTPKMLPSSLESTNKVNITENCPQLSSVVALETPLLKTNYTVNSNIEHSEKTLESSNRDTASINVIENEIYITLSPVQNHQPAALSDKSRNPLPLRHAIDSTPVRESKRPECKLEETKTPELNGVGESKRPECKLEATKTPELNGVGERKRPECKLEATETPELNEVEERKRPECKLEATKTPELNGVGESKRPECKLEATKTPELNGVGERKRPECKLEATKTPEVNEVGEKKRPECKLKATKTTELNPKTTVESTALLEESGLDANDIVGRVIRDATKHIQSLKDSISEPLEDIGIGYEMETNEISTPEAKKNGGCCPISSSSNEKSTTPVRKHLVDVQTPRKFDELETVSDMQWKTTNAELKNESFNYSGKKPKKRVSYYVKPASKLPGQLSPGTKATSLNLKRTPDKGKLLKTKSPLKKQLAQAITTSYKVSSFRDIVSTQPIPKTEKINILTPRKSPKSSNVMRKSTDNHETNNPINTVVVDDTTPAVSKTPGHYPKYKQSILERDIKLKLKAIDSEEHKTQNNSKVFTGDMTNNTGDKKNNNPPANSGKPVHNQMKPHFLIPEVLEDNARFVSITTRTSTITSTTLPADGTVRTLISTRRNSHINSFESNSSSGLSLFGSLGDIQYRNEHTISSFQNAFSLMNDTPFKQLITGTFNCVSPMPETPYKHETPRKITPENSQDDDRTLHSDLKVHLDLKTPLKPIITSSCSSTDIQNLQDELALTPDGNSKTSGSSGNSDINDHKSTNQTNANDLRCHVESMERIVNGCVERSIETSVLQPNGIIPIRKSPSGVNVNKPAISRNHIEYPTTQTRLTNNLDERNILRGIVKSNEVHTTAEQKPSNLSNVENIKKMQTQECNNLKSMPNNIMRTQISRSCNDTNPRQTTSQNSKIPGTKSHSTSTSDPSPSHSNSPQDDKTNAEYQKKTSEDKGHVKVNKISENLEGSDLNRPGGQKRIRFVDDKVTRKDRSTSGDKQYKIRDMRYVETGSGSDRSPNTPNSIQRNRRRTPSPRYRDRSRPGRDRRDIDQDKRYRDPSPGERNEQRSSGSNERRRNSSPERQCLSQSEQHRHQSPRRRYPNPERRYRRRSPIRNGRRRHPSPSEVHRERDKSRRRDNRGYRSSPERSRYRDKSREVYKQYREDSPGYRKCKEPCLEKPRRSRERSPPNNKIHDTPVKQVTVRERETTYSYFTETRDSEDEKDIHSSRHKQKKSSRSPDRNGSERFRPKRDGSSSDSAVRKSNEDRKIQVVERAKEDLKDNESSPHQRVRSSMEENSKRRSESSETSNCRLRYNKMDMERNTANERNDSNRDKTSPSGSNNSNCIIDSSTNRSDHSINLNNIDGENAITNINIRNIDDDTSMKNSINVTAVISEEEGLCSSSSNGSL